MSFKYYEDPILGKGRAADVTGGTGGTSYVGGEGIAIGGETISLVTADVADVLNGTANTEAVDVKALRGALTAGQAVDVTSAPDGVTGDYRGTFSVTGSTLGFASFPKFASGLSYLFLADLTATTSGTVTPSGTWLDGTTTAKSLTAGTSTRVAMLFNAANKGKLTFASTGSVSVTNCREYEVTACSDEAIAYIAQLANPDAFASYYLVKPDMVQPWTYIIDMGSSSAVTIASGLSYKLNAATGTHTLTVDTCPAGYDGRDAIIRITLGGSGVIQAVAPLQLGGALVPYAINNCVVRFRDGEAVLLVEDTLAGYVVTLTSGTGDGSLPYGLAASGVPYIAFSPSTDGTPVELSGATASEEVTVVGNGYTSTTLTGAVHCGENKVTVANLGLNNVQIVGGTMTLGDAYIPSGSTVAVSGGGLAVEKVTGAGAESVIDLGGTWVFARNGQTVNISGCEVVSGGYNPDDISYGSQGAIYMSAGGTLNITESEITQNQHGGLLLVGYSRDTNVNIISSVVSGNTGTDIVGTYNKLNLTISGSTIGTVKVAASGNVTFTGSNVVNRVTQLYAGGAGSGTVTLTSGAVLDLTGNTNATPIAPGGGITFESGGATVLYGDSAGVPTSSAVISGATVTSLGNDGGVFMRGTVVSSGALTSGSVSSAIIKTAGLDYGLYASSGLALSNCMIATARPNFYGVWTLSNCEIVGADGTSVSFGNATLESDISLTLSNCTLRGKQIRQNSAIPNTNRGIELSGEFVIVGGGDVAFNTSTQTALPSETPAKTLCPCKIRIADNAMIDLSACTITRAIQAGGGITVGTGVKIKVYGASSYTDFNPSPSAGTIIRIIQNDGTIIAE